MLFPVVDDAERIQRPGVHLEGRRFAPDRCCQVAVSLLPDDHAESRSALVRSYLPSASRHD